MVVTYPRTFSGVDACVASLSVQQSPLDALSVPTWPDTGSEGGPRDSPRAAVARFCPIAAAPRGPRAMFLAANQASGGFVRRLGS